MEAAAAANAQPHAADDSRIQECPDFEEKFGLPPGADLDAVTDAVLQKADEEAEMRQGESLPTPPPGLRPGSAAYRVFREEAYQMLRLQLRERRSTSSVTTTSRNVSSSKT